MFDNLPFESDDINTIKAFLNSGLLDYKTDSSTPKKDTGELLRTTYSKYKNLTVAVKYNEIGQPIKLTSRGSFHYLMNNGIHNANQFSFEDMKSYLLQFEKNFNVDLEELKLLPPEFAVNFQIPFEVEKVVQNTFFEQRKPFINNSPGDPSKISGKHSNDYRLKTYSKSYEFPQYCELNTLRLEYQAKKTRALGKLGITTLKDLLDLNNWIKLKDLHLSYFSHLVIFDYNISVPKNSKYKKRIADLSNFIHWENLVKNIKKGYDYYTKYNDEVELLNSLSERYGENLLSKILVIAEYQWNKNLGTCFEYSYLRVKKPKDAPLLKPKDAPFIVCNPCKYFKQNRYKISAKPFNRICPVTGLDLKHEKPDAKYILTKTIRHLMNNDVDKYYRLCSEYLPNTGTRPKYESTIIAHLCKQIRNKFDYQTKIKQAGYNAKQYPDQHRLDL